MIFWPNFSSVLRKSQLSCANQALDFPKNLKSVHGVYEIFEFREEGCSKGDADGLKNFVGGWLPKIILLAAMQTQI